MELLEVIGNGDSFWKSILSVKMQYNSLLFFVFFLLFLCVFFLCRDGKKKQICILAGNIIFYVWAGWQPMLIVLGSGLIANSPMPTPPAMAPVFLPNRIAKINSGTFPR